MLVLEPILTARLEAIDGTRGVHGLPEFSDVAAAGKLAPCYYLVFDGYRVLEHAGAGERASVESRWLVVCAAKHAGRAASGAPVRAAAAPLVDAAIAALLGWRPAPGCSPMKLAEAPRAASAAGVLYVPLAFTTRHVVGGEHP